MDLTILLPCLNEEETLDETIKEIKRELKKFNIKSEILVVDNGSCDNSIKIAKENEVRIVRENLKGYGSALLTGIKNSQGKYIIFGDCDRSYHFENIEEYLSSLEQGYDIVIGSRYKGVMEKDSMPFSHKYLGTPIITFLGRKLYKVSVSDFNSGLRGVNKEKILSINLNCMGMEFASEMLIKGAKCNLKIKEIPINFYKDKRGRKPHLRAFRDGMRHLKILLKELRK